MEEENPSSGQDKEVKSKQGLLNYKDKGSQTVFSFLGIELTAPAGLKNPGIVYLAFLVINMVLFFGLISFVRK